MIYTFPIDGIQTQYHKIEAEKWCYNEDYGYECCQDSHIMAFFVYAFWYSAQDLSGVRLFTPRPFTPNFLP